MEMGFIGLAKEKAEVTIMRNGVPNSPETTYITQST